MIPIIAVMIAVYGTGRLLNDCFARYPNSKYWTVLTWLISIVVIIVLLLLAVLMNLSTLTSTLS